MKKKTRKKMAALLTAAIFSFGLGSINAGAASWTASHVNITGAPSSESTIDYITVYHRAAGASAVCNYNSHTNSAADGAYTYIGCTNYSMTTVSIYNIATKTCKPSVGSPTADIAVNYKISAKTLTANDTFWTKGNITKIS
ncbi:MAG: hypothetical protein LUG56_05340 [Lachnospiraceae bacterium]|nr:hypothetical protein [Lachnospiraceae bacterium]MCD7841877.1 hypothetical protein [Lachnospiraceae bacterium]